MENTLLTASLQTAWAGWFAITHYVPLPPLNDLSKEAFPQEKKVNRTMFLLISASVAGFALKISWLIWVGALFWSLAMIGHIFSWRVPYLFGWPGALLKEAGRDNGKTYHFLPPIKDRPIPDLSHCVLGILKATSFFSVWKAL